MEILIDERTIAAQIKRSAAALSARYSGAPLLFVSVLKGAFIFMADYIRNVDISCEAAFMAVSSYGDSTESSGDVKIRLDIDRDISQYHVVILEDITDTGRTLAKVVDMLRDRHPLSLEVISLLDKPGRRVNDFVPDEALFTIPDLFVVGYGLDYAEKFRNLPYIAVLTAQ